MGLIYLRLILKNIICFVFLDIYILIIIFFLRYFYGRCLFYLSGLELNLKKI